MELTYRYLKDEDIVAIEPWFDDVDTQKYLGDRDWLHRLLKLVNTATGTEFRGRTVKGRHALLAILNKKPIALIDLEIYRDETASLALIVDLNMRGKGISKQIHQDIWRLPEMNGINKIIGGVNPENIASIKSLGDAGASISRKLNDDGYFDTELSRLI